MNGCEINDYDAILDRHRALLAREACHFAYFQLLVIGSKDSPSIVHTPFTLLPSQFPRAQFDQAWDASSAFGLLVHRISRDLSWLEEAHKRSSLPLSFICFRPSVFFCFTDQRKTHTHTQSDRDGFFHRQSPQNT